jgi:hypothetical protein
MPVPVAELPAGQTLADGAHATSIRPLAVDLTPAPDRLPAGAITACVGRDVAGEVG